MTGCADGSPSSAWDDLSGTIYFIGGTTQDSIKSVDPRTGAIAPVPESPAAYYLAADPAGNWLLATLGGVYKYDLRSRVTSIIAPNVVEYNHYEGSVSPDGQRVVYDRSERTGFAIVVSDVTGANERILVGPTPGSGQYNLSWVDNNHIVFVDQQAGVARLWTVNADGTSLGYFASDTGIVAGAVAAAASVERLVIARRPMGLPPSELWELDYSGNMRRLVPVDGLYPWFTFSPDGKYLTYCAPTESSTADLYLVHIGSGETRQLTFDPGYECSPTWVR